MRAACLALALCVSYAAAAITAPDLKDSELTPGFDGALNGRQYVVAQVDNQVTYTTVAFDVKGASSAEKAYYGCFHGEEPVVGSEVELTANKDKKPETCSVTGEQAAGTGDITFRVYTKDGSGKKTVIATSSASLLTVLELKSTKPENWVIKREGCSVKFDILGLYSNPPLRSVCGFYQDKDWIKDSLVDSADEKTAWTQAPLSDTEPDSDFVAWKLDKKSLEVGATTVPTMDVYAGCKFHLDGQEYAEFELTQLIPFTDNEKNCEANPLVAFEKSYEGDNEIKVTSFGTTEENCWTGETYSTSQITCDNSKAFTVFCDGGEYKYTDSSVEEPAKYDSNTTALAFADETCGTAAILPVSLLVGALALLASRA